MRLRGSFSNFLVAYKHVFPRLWIMGEHPILPVWRAQSTFRMPRIVGGPPSGSDRCYHHAEFVQKRFDSVVGRR